MAIPAAQISKCCKQVDRDNSTVKIPAFWRLEGDLYEQVVGECCQGLGIHVGGDSGFPAG